MGEMNHVKEVDTLGLTPTVPTADKTQLRAAVEYAYLDQSPLGPVDIYCLASKLHPFLHI